MNYAVQKIMLLLNGGLGNRLLPALSALYVGFKLGVPAYFDWRVTQGCSCSFEQLFKPRLNQTALTGPLLHYCDERPAAKQTFMTMLRTQPELHVRSPIGFDVFHNLYPGEAQSWMAENFAVYFEPIEALMEKIDAVGRQNSLVSALGVHVRRGDKVGRSRNLPAMAQYFEAIETLLNPAMPVFLATDDGCSVENSAVIRGFQKRYGKKLLMAPKNSVRRDVVGVQEAVVDLWLLRNCLCLVGTKCSTFSQAAALGRKALLI